MDQQEAAKYKEPRYKELERISFTKLCGPNFRSLKTKDLVAASLAGHIPKGELDGIIKNLTELARLRKERPRFGGRCLSHEYFADVIILGQIVYTLKNRRAIANTSLCPQQNTGPTTPTAYKTGTTLEENTVMVEFLDRSLDESDFILFLDEVETLVGTILNTWKAAAAASEQKKLFSASMVSNCVFREAISLIETEAFLNPLWFDDMEDVKKIAPHRFLKALDMDLGNTLFRSYIGQICETTILGPRAEAPLPILIMIQKESERKGYFLVRIVRHILACTRHLKEDIFRPRTQTILRYTRSCVEDFKAILKGDVPEWSKVELKLERCQDILSLAQIHSLCIAQLLVVFRMVPDKPLIPMLAHFYIASVSAGYTKVEEMETLCESELFAPILFWNGRPDTQVKWTESVIHWVLARHNKVSKISATRYRFTLIDIIAKHKYGIDRVTQEKLCSGGQPLWKAVERQLDADHQFPDLAAMWNSIRNTVSQELGRDNIEEQELVHLMIRKARPFNEDSKKLLEAILKDWETSKSKSPFLLL